MTISLDMVWILKSRITSPCKVLRYVGNDFFFFGRGAKVRTHDLLGRVDHELITWSRVLWTSNDR